MPYLKRINKFLQTKFRTGQTFFRGDTNKISAYSNIFSSNSNKISICYFIQKQGFCCFA